MQRSKPWIEEDEEYLQNELERCADEWEEYRKWLEDNKLGRIKKFRRFNSKKRVRNRSGIRTNDNQLPF